MRALLLMALTLPSGVALADVLNYDYVYLSKNGTESDPGSRHHGGNAAGGFKSFGQRTHAFVSYDDGALYAGSHPNWDYNLKTWRIGAGGHYLLGKRTMIAPSMSVFHSSGDVMAPSWAAPRKLDGTGYIVQFDLRHAFTHWLELTVAARRTKFVDGTSNEYIGGLMFHLNHHWAAGALYHDRQQRRSTEFTVRYYY